MADDIHPHHMVRASKIVSLDVNGLRSSNDPLKRRKIFKWLNVHGYDIVFLQETHSDSTVEKNMAERIGWSGIVCSWGYEELWGCYPF